LLLLASIAGRPVIAILPDPVGWWTFDNSADLLAAETGFGVALELNGTQSAVAGPEPGNDAIQIGPGSFYRMHHRIDANGGGSAVNEYSLLVDFMVPQNGIWHAFFQTAMSNTNDGDFFINTTGNIGVAAVGYSSYAVVPGEWYRLVISVRNGSFFNAYLDGQLFLTGLSQEVDGRFALDSLLLMFADENAEDGMINCSEVKIWDQALGASVISEMGGFGHQTGPYMMTRIPYLQSPSKYGMSICWHDTALAGTAVAFGTTTDLGLVSTGTSELLAEPYRWHTVKLEGLQAGTRYYYKVLSGSGESSIFSFKTLPEDETDGTLRFLIFGDVHSTDTAASGKVIRAARDKVKELYGDDIQEQVNGIFNTGDIVLSGSSIGEYTTKYFSPMAPLTGMLGTLVVAGNHEMESPYFYQYLKLDEQSAFDEASALHEKVWFLRSANALFIGLNTNITAQYGTVMADWLDAKLEEAENDATLDFVFLFFHHPPFSELWYPVINFDNGPTYVKNKMFSVIKKYTKVQEVHYGHTHGFERGTITSGMENGDFRIICGGGGGGLLDPWTSGQNHNYDDIHITLSHYCYQILEISTDGHYTNSMYSLGSPTDPRENILLDSWYRDPSADGPMTPEALEVEDLGESLLFRGSAFEGVDSLMTVEIQVLDSADHEVVQYTRQFHFTDVYGVNAEKLPVDLNMGKSLYAIEISAGDMPGGSHVFRLRYRDHNLKWSSWSNTVSFFSTGLPLSDAAVTGLFLGQAVPNPSADQALLSYKLPELCAVEFRLFDSASHLIGEYSVGTQEKGSYLFELNTAALQSGVYFCTMNAGQFQLTRKVVVR